MKASGTLSVGIGGHIAAFNHASKATGQQEFESLVCTENLIRVDVVMESPKLAE
jgi:hypothetical protein